MRFKGLDLNLLVAFEILMEERSVRKAADRLNLSQPATSSALARLRTFFDDPILVLQGKRMYSTPYADSLLPHVRHCLQMAGVVISMSSGFDPATSARTFRIIASDYVATALLAPVARRLADTAPNIAFEFTLPDAAALAAVERGTVDLLITPADFGNETNIRELLLVESYVVVGCKSNPAFAGGLSEEAFLAAGHVDVAVGSTRTQVFADRQLALMGINRRIELTAASFAVLPWLVMGTPRLTVMHKRLADTMAIHLPIAIAPMPFDFPLMDQTLQYHRSRTGDEGLAWLIGELRREVDQPSI